MKITPTFYLDSQLWETSDGFKAPTLRQLLGKLPAGTEIDGYYPGGTDVRNSGALGQDAQFVLSEKREQRPLATKIPPTPPPKVDRVRTPYVAVQPSAANIGKSFAWSDDRVRELRRLVNQGFSAEECAQQLGCTRNAVISKCRRQGLQLKNPVGWASPRIQASQRR